MFFEPPKFKDGGGFAGCPRIADVVKRCGGPGGIEPGTGAPPEIQATGGGLARGTSPSGRIVEAGGAFPVHHAVDAAGSGDWLSAGPTRGLCGGGSRAVPAPDKIEQAPRRGSAPASIDATSGAGGRCTAFPRTRSSGSPAR